MQQKTPTPRRKFHKRQAVAYYRESPNGDDAASIAAQREIVARWAAENDHEVVEEVVERETEPRPRIFEMGVPIQQHATKTGDMLYVLAMHADLWRHWRRCYRASQFSNLSKNQGDRAVFVTTDNALAERLSCLIFNPMDYCCSFSCRARKAAAWHRAKRMGNQAADGGQPQP